jgi:hypothetical protein
LPGNWPPASVHVNGNSVAYSNDRNVTGWHVEGNTMTTVIRTQRLSVRDSVTFTVRTDPKLARDRAMLDAFAGKVSRLRETYDILNATWPAAWSPDHLIDAMQTGDRISYHPETAFAEVSALPKKLAGLSAEINAMHATESSPAFAQKDPQRAHPSRALEDYNRLIDTALAHLVGVN